MLCRGIWLQNSVGVFRCRREETGGGRGRRRWGAVNWGECFCFIFVTPWFYRLAYSSNRTRDVRLRGLGFIGTSASGQSDTGLRVKGFIDMRTQAITVIITHTMSVFTGMLLGLALLVTKLRRRRSRAGCFNIILRLCGQPLTTCTGSCSSVGVFAPTC